MYTHIFLNETGSVFVKKIKFLKITWKIKKNARFNRNQYDFD